MKEYYDARAAECDEWYLGTGLFSARERAGWDEAVARLELDVTALTPAKPSTWRAEPDFSPVTCARRVAPELVVVDSASRPDHGREEHQERVLNDGCRYRVYKRYFDAEELARELGRGRVLHAGDWFVMVAAGHAGKS
jgi:hypothetical protein